MDSVNSTSQAFYQNLRQGKVYADPTAKGAASSDKPASKGTTSDSSDRTIHDTVKLSDGSKIVNLARGYDLAEQVRNEKDPEKVQQLLKSGQEDIGRISYLFGEVSREIFNIFKSFRRS